MLTKRSPNELSPLPGNPRRRGVVVAIVLATGAFMTAGLGSSAERVEEQVAQEFRVIVHPSSSVSFVSSSFLSGAFLKKIGRWENEEVIRPVDLRPDSAVRELFSRKVLKRSVASVRHYWQQKIFSGRNVPPPELDSDAAVIRYVSRYPGAVGYVSPAAKLHNVKVLVVQ